MNFTHEEKRLIISNPTAGFNYLFLRLKAKYLFNSFVAEVEDSLKFQPDFSSPTLSEHEKYELKETALYYLKKVIDESFSGSMELLFERFEREELICESPTLIAYFKSIEKKIKSEKKQMESDTLCVYVSKYLNNYKSNK